MKGLRRKMLLYTTSPDVILEANGCKRCEYIEAATDGLYIQTDKYATSHYGFETKLEMYTTSGQVAFGTVSNDSIESYDAFWLVVWNNIVFAKIPYISESNLSSMDVTSLHTYKAKDGDLSIDGEIVKTYSVPTTYTAANTKYKIFAGRANGWFFTGKCYYIRFWDSDVLVMDLIPAYKTSTSEYGLFDMVERRFYGSANKKKFTGKLLGGGKYKCLIISKLHICPNSNEERRAK